jgi:hypothetical protein
MASSALRRYLGGIKGKVVNYSLPVVDKNICAAAGIKHMGEYGDKDVFIVGYPKSGNTWMQNIIAALVYGITPEYTSDGLIQTIVPDVHTFKYYRRFANPMHFKSHDLPLKNFRRVIYIVRDGRDVMVSYYHHQQIQVGKDFDFMKMVTDGSNVFGGKWSSHIQAWQDNPFDAEILQIRYEDLKTNTVGELGRICTFLGVERDEAEIDRVAKSVTFDKLRLQENRFGHPLESSHIKSPTDVGKNFMRRGVVGSFKDEMPSDILQAFLDESSSTLQKLGYIE